VLDVRGQPARRAAPRPRHRYISAPLLFAASVGLFILIRVVPT
jgi:hypothetical protein